MKIYLVGGAVRDKYLGYPSTENDWVVVGAYPTDLIQQGFQQVGQDFPVFLHPVTREEYALARTERKSGPGYHGFTLNFTPEVSLQDDLARRDLTINAMAMDEKGHLIDPYHGLDDLKAKLFRHVSPAFVEDPVRVLRVARFSARYHHLGFTLAAQTRCLMYLMVRQGELNHLVPERVWQEWLKSLTEQDPAQFIIILRACNALAVVLPELDALFGVPNDASDYPEIDAGIHSLNALSMAAKLSTEQDVRFAATLLKLGQVTIPSNQWPCHPKHNYSGKELIEQICQRLRVPVAYRQLAIMSTELHLQIHRLYELSADEILTCLEKADAFRRPERFDKLLLICEADKRGSDSSRNYPQANHWRQLRQACHLINASDLIKQGMSGEAIKAGLTQSRLERINSIIGTIHE